MENKKIGIIIFVVSLVLLLLFISVTRSLNHDIEALGCFQNPDCQRIETSLSGIHFAFGLFGFLFALGVYLIFFTKGEEAIVRRLEDDSKKKITEEKFAILLKGLDPFEKEAIILIKEQNGITQNTLALRTTMSKAKLSQVLSSLEKKGLIRRIPDKKTLAIYLAEGFKQ